MSRNVRRWILIITTVILASAAREVRASHAMGADMTYECLGGNTYRIKVSFYRDCVGAAAPSNISVSIRSVSCNRTLSLTCNKVTGTGQEVNYLCPSAVSTCNGGTFTGIQEYVYQGVITLPMQCPDWQFSYSLCCRNAAINTISNPGSNTFYIYANLNNQAVQCNSSPQFSNKPVPFACLGQQFCFNHGAYDADGDSLVYSLVNPKQSATQNVTYINPYSATNPVTSSPAMTFNNATGDICFTPTQQQVSVMAVLVSEYRNGVLIGQVVRDIQLTVLNCNNDLPVLSGINGTNNFNITACAGQQICFNINSSDPNASQNLSLIYNNSVPGATFTTTSGSRPTGTFCWTPTRAQINNAPYCFTVQVKDDACPFNGSQTFSYCVTVQGITVNAGADQNIACSDIATITANATGGTPPYTYLWSNGFTNPTQSVGVGTYVVTVSDGLCSNTDTVRVISAFEPVAAFQSVSGCASTAISFTDQSTTPGTISDWTWNFGDGSTSTLQHPSHSYASPGTYQVLLVVENVYGCIDSISHPVTVNPLPAGSFTNGTACAGSAVQFTNTSVPAGTSWNWTFSNGSTSTQQNPSITFATAGTYTATLIVTDINGCIDTVTQNVIVSPLPVAAFTNSVPLCIGTTIQFTDQSTGAPVSWQWTFGNGNTSNQQNPSNVYTGGGNYPVSLTITNAAGCTATLTKNININTPPTGNAGPDVNLCLGSSITLTANGGNTYQWQPGNLTGSSVVVSPGVNTSYSVLVTDVNGCTDYDTINVTVLPLPVATTGPDQTICAGNSATLTASGGVSYSWSPVGATTQNITVTPANSGTYAVNVTGANGCTSTAFVNVTVRPLPVITLPVAVFFCNGLNQVLNPGTGTAYNWSTGATTQTITVSSAGTYSVTVTNSFGCTATGNTQVTVGGQTVNNNPAAVLCQGQSATLSAQNGISYLWSTGATGQTISVNTAGTYQVTVTEPSGCTGVISNTVIVNPVPVVNFTPIDVCINSPVQFNDLSHINGSTITSWNWNLGDGNVSYQQNPSHNYNTAGSYAITLTVTSAEGCTATMTDSVNVYALPMANFDYNFACEGTPIPFVDQSTTAFGNIISWFWDFKDGTTSTQQNPSHAFPAAGTYTVELTVTTAGGCTDTRSRVIHIYPKPDVDFSMSKTVLCPGEAVMISNLSTTFNGGINDWTWVFGDGTIANNVNPSHIYTTPGTFHILLSATTSHGCIDTVSHPVTVEPLPVANAGSDVAICIGQSTTLTASGGATYLWTPGGATTASITVSPNTTTTYTVIATSIAGCTDTDSILVTVRALPVANAGTDKTICIGKSTSLTATGGTGYSWSTGATTAGITVSPATTTNYIVTVTGANTCINRDTVRVTVNPLPAASAGADQVICTGTTTTLTATGGTTYLWSPGGSTAQSIYVSPSVASNYTVLVTDANGCSRSDTVRVTLNPTPVVTLSNAFFCSGYSATLDAGNPGMTYDWSPNGETTQSITVTTPGVYSVVVTNSFGCNGSGFANVVEGGTALGATPLAMHGCAGESIQLDAGNPGMTYSWSNGATSQVITVASGGLYTVTVTDPGGCVATFTDSVTFHPLPVAAFLANDNCLGLTTSFTDNSSLSQGSIMDWQWDLGNGYASSIRNPVYQYPTPGTYNVQLLVTSDMGCRDSVTKNITVHPSPNVAFTAGEVCEGDVMSFTNTSTVSPGTISTSAWSFGDGNTSQILNTQHTYSNAGTYTISLVSGTAAGCKDTLYGSVVVHERAVPQFIAFPVCEGQSTEFINTTSIQNAAISDYTWYFGDGTGSNDPNPVHRYASPGNYTVVLIVGTEDNCVDSVAQVVVVYARPQAAVSVAPVCEGNPAIFVNNSTPNGGGAILTYFWDFGNSVYSGMQQPMYTYPIPGNYNASLIVGSVYGCTDTVNSTVIVHAAPAASFVATSGCLGTSAQFDAIASTNASQYMWNFGDLTLGMGVNTTHSYLNTGSYPVQLIASSAQGCRDTIMQTVNVYPVPVANFFSANVCHQTQMVFTDLSSISGGGVFQNNWTFGDGNNSTGSQVSNNYIQPGIYNVQLTVTSAQGCSSSVSKPVQVYDLPLATFTANDVCLNLPTNFNDHSSVINGQVTNWMWTLGDGTVSNMQHPIHTYGSSGTYPVSLQVMSSLGCRSNAIDSVAIFRLPTPQPFAQGGCVGVARMFTDLAPAISPNDIQVWQWNFGNGLVSSQPAPTITFTTSGPQTVTLTTTNSAGCKSTAQVTVIANPLPVAGFTNSNACDGTAVQFNNTSSIGQGSSITSYLWNFGDGTLNSTLSSPSHIYSQAGTYNVTLIAGTNEGCLDTVTATVVVHPLPVPNFVHTPVSGCGPVNVTFNDSSYIANGTIINWYWNFGDGSASTIQDPVHVYSTPGTYAVSLTVTSNNGCQNTSTNNNAVTVYPGPNANFEPNVTSQQITNPVFEFNNYSTGAISYNWLFGDGTGSPQFEPQHTYADTGRYTITLWVTNSYGCRDSATREVKVDPIFTFFIPNSFTPNDDGKNDNFHVKGISIVDVKLNIFNRWGDHIFFKEGMQEDAAWDGSVIGNPEKAKEDVYVYQVYVKDVWGIIHEKVGHVSLVR